MKKYINTFALLIFTGLFFYGCVSNITDPAAAEASASISIKIIKPVANDSVSYIGETINYSLTTNSGINFIELHINGKYYQTYKANNDGSKPIITINLDSTYINKSITYQLKYFDINGYSETPVYSVIITSLRIPPYAPFGLTLTKLATSSCNISWRDSSSGSVAYQVFRKTDNGEYGIFTTTSAGTNNVNDESIIPNKVYYYKVRGFNKYGYSDYSMSLSTLGSGTSADVNPPDLWSGYAESSKSIVLTWIDNSNNENYFSIERKGLYTNFAKVGAVTRNTTSFRDSIGLSAGTEYTYRIKVFSSKDSSWSNEFSVKTLLYNLLSPTITAITNPYSKKVIINWKDNDNSVGRFRIERKEELGTFAFIAEAESWVSSYNDVTVVPNKTYVYRIRTFDNESTSPYSNELGISTLPLPYGVPQSFTGSFSTFLSSINLSWSLSDNTITKVIIERRLYSEGTNSYIVVGEVNSDKNTFSDTGTSCQQIYVYRLRSTDGTYFSAYSTEYIVANTNTCN